MKKKIVVYTICLNEEKFVDRWVDSMQEADELIVLDTGSTDQTVKKLKERKVKVYEQKIIPWRFDEARNISLSHVPLDTDICVCTDLDEVFEPGWREKLEKCWNDANPTRARYLYHWKLDEEDKPVLSFLSDKIHSREGYSWRHPVHEVLIPQIEEKVIEVPIVLKHYPDASKSRSSYLPLLELSVQEDPLDDRNLHYLGREYMFYHKWDKCIETLHKHLNCKKATWKDERCASMRFISRAYLGKNYIEEAEDWLKRAIQEAPYLREGYIELANLYIVNNDYEKAYPILKQAEQIKEKSKSYINEEFAWNDVFFDLLSLAAFYTKHYDEAVKMVKEAIKRNPKEKRYEANLNLMLPYSLTSSHEQPI